MKSLVSYINESKMEAKTYSLQQNVGKSKYVVNYFKGEKLNKDGSPMMDIAIFKNKKQANEFVNDLIGKGYKGNGIF